MFRHHPKPAIDRFVLVKRQLRPRRMPERRVEIHVPIVGFLKQQKKRQKGCERDEESPFAKCEREEQSTRGTQCKVLEGFYKPQFPLNGDGKGQRVGRQDPAKLGASEKVSIQTSQRHDGGQKRIKEKWEEKWVKKWKQKRRLTPFPFPFKGLPVTPYPIHIRTLTGLEEVLAGELTALGAQSVQVGSRLLTCLGDQELLYKANLWCRTAIRVLRPLASFPAGDEKAFYEGVSKLDWSPWLSPEGTLAVEANVHSSFTTHSLFLAQLTKDAVVDQFRAKSDMRPSVDLEKPELRIAVALFQNTAQIFVDSSGESLHRRGYRRQAGEAPISEALAAGILKLSKWDGSKTLVDPMCGSGTFCIEAGLMLRNIAPGLLRQEFGFQRWKDFDEKLWKRLCQEARAAALNTQGQIVGIEKNPEVVDVARANIQLAGLQNLIRIESADFFEWMPKDLAPGILVMNPPYDERLPVDNVALLYQRIGDRLKATFGGWTAQILCGNLEAAKFIGLRTSKRRPLFNGAIECRLLEFELRTSDKPTGQPMPSRPAPVLRPKWTERKEAFGNRLTKNLKHLGKWARREGITCYRVYNWDIPELPFMLDIYDGQLHFAEVVRNQTHSPIEHETYMQMMIETASQILGIDPAHVIFKKRKPQKSGGFQYSQHDTTDEYREVSEGGHRFLVNLSDYLDVGLFLDHRATRAMVQAEAKGKDFLNLFAYTGSFSVYAGVGGARSTMTVDSSRKYLEWARKNLRLNGLSGSKHQTVRDDVFEFLEHHKGMYDLCVVDPPTRSVNRSMERVFDVQTDHVRLLTLVLARMRKGGTVYFSTNYRTFELSAGELSGCTIREITRESTSLDFARKPNHRAWVLVKG